MDHNLQTHDIPKPIYEKLLNPASARVEFRAASGLSNARVFCCRSPQGQLCLRGWPKLGPDRRHLEQMRHFVSLTHEHQIEVLPKYVTDSQGHAFHWQDGRFWELTEWMPGVADYLQQPTMERLEAACEVLGRLHRVWSSQSQLGTSHAVQNRIDRLRDWLVPRSAGSVQHLASSAALAFVSDESELSKESRVSQLWWATMEAVQRHGPKAQELLMAIADQTETLHFVLRDVWSEHILFTGQRVTGIIDLGASRIDEPATDLARLLGSLEPGSAERFRLGIAAYQRQQPKLDRHRVVVLDYASCLLSAAQWAKWLVVERKEFDTEITQLLDRWAGFLKRIEAFPWDEMLDWARGH